MLADGEVAAVYRKMYLPNYGVFDEQRYFQSGAEAGIFELNGIPIGLTICEDIWEPGPPAMTEALAGAQVIVNLSASPYRVGYGHGRERMLAQRAVDNLAAVVFVNTVGGQDELVFDGHSLAIDQDGRVLARCPQFEECLDALHDRPARGRRPRACATRATAPTCAASGAPRRSPSRPSSTSRASRWPPAATTVGGAIADLLGPEAEVYAALRTGLRDYVDKNGFERVVLGPLGRASTRRWWR